MGQKLVVSNDEDQSTFIRFMIANFDYSHEFFRLQLDLAKRLKLEEMRAAYIMSAQDFNNF